MSQMLLLPEHYISEHYIPEHYNYETKWNWEKNTKYMSWMLLDECS